MPFPDWLLYTDVAEAEAALQPVVDSLGKPRRLHVIDVAVPQAGDVADSMLDVEPGDYRRVTVADARLPTAVDAVCMLLSAELLVNPALRGTLRHVWIESGGGSYSDGYSDAYDGGLVTP